jgi:hypothetical protein
MLPLTVKMPAPKSSRQLKQDLVKEVFTLREREGVLETLRHGTLLLTSYGEPMKDVSVVWIMIREAMLVTSRMRNKEIRWLLSGTRCTWPEIVNRWKEVFEIELTRLVSGMKEGDERIMYASEPTDMEVDRMLVTFSWFRFLRSHDPALMRKCLMALAAGASLSTVGKMWRPGEKTHRQSVYELRVRACKQIVDALLTEYGIRWRGKGFGVN